MHYTDRSRMKRYKTVEDKTPLDELIESFNEYVGIQGQINKGLLDMFTGVLGRLEVMDLRIQNIEQVLDLSTPEQALEDLMNEIEEYGVPASDADDKAD